MKKLIQKLALVAIAMLYSMAVAAQTTFVSGDFLYTVLDPAENTVSIKANVSDFTGALTIPATVEEGGITYKVTKVANEGFYNHKNITSIAFEGSNLEEIGKRGFKDTQGVSGIVTIPASVTTIGEDGFCRCFADEFVFASGSQLETLGPAAFWEGKFTTMPNLPNTLTNIGDECFKRCSELTTAWLPGSVTKLPYATFAECPKLTSATIAATVTEVGEAAFWSCPLLASVTFEESSVPLNLIGRTFQYCNALTSINLPDRINQMGEGVLYSCKNLESAHFPTGMTLVPASTFDNCYAMSSVTGINDVTRIERSAFGDCHEFTSFTIPANVEFIGDYAFANQTNCATYTFAGNNVKTIGSYAFQNNKVMTSFTLPSSVTQLGNEVFKGCTELTSFVIPDGATFGTGLFVDCVNLASITFPENVTKIPDYMFQNCTALSGKFTIPATVTRIGTDAFRACNNITEVEFPANSQLQTIGWEAFFMDPAKAQLERFIMPNTVTTLENGALRGCKKLDWDNFHLSPLVTKLPGHVFCDCGFTQFPLEETNITELEHNVFDGNCFTEYHLPKSVTMTGDANFYANHKLERFYFEDGYDLTGIKSWTFAYCENLNYIYLPVATPPTMGYYSMPDAKQIFVDVPAEAIATYKSNSDWANFKYALTLESTGATDLAIDDASQRFWSIYEYNGLRYLYNDQSSSNSDLPNNLMSWTFNNTVEKEYSLLLNACNRYYTDTNDYLEVSLVKYSADGTPTTVQSKTVKIDKCSNNYYAYADKYEQVLINFDNALEVGKYAVTFKRLGDNGKFVWNAKMVPTTDINIIEPITVPAGAGDITVTGDLIQVYGDNSEITLTAATMDGASWISFANWTVDGTQVGTAGDNVYTFTPNSSTKVVANYDITPQNIPADLDNFVQTQAVLYPANPTNNSSSIYWYPNTGGKDNFVYIRDGNSATYFVKSTKPALYNLKFKTSSKYYDTSAYIVDVINADGEIIFTKQNDIAQTIYGWYDDDMNQEEVAITTPLMPNEVYSVRLTFISKTGETNEIANFNFVQFEVAAIVPETIALNKAETTVKVEFDETLIATLATSTNDAITEGYDGIVWTTSDATVATVNTNGKVTAVAPGTATITATASGRDDIELAATCVVTVPQHVTDITVPGTQILYDGNVAELTAIVAPENAEDKTLTWTSSDAETVDVDATGKITAIKAGTATITVTAADRDKVSKTIDVTVKQHVTAITLNQTETTISKNTTLQLTATYTPEDAALKEVTWTSSDANVATVSETGLVTAVAGGVATITATAKDGQGATAACTVTVNVPVQSVTLDQSSATVYKDVTIQLTATVNPDDATVKTVTWTSSDATVASVSATGLVTALSAGDATITVKSDADASMYATFAIHVMSASAAGTGVNQLLFHEEVNNASFGDNCIAWDNATDKKWVANSIVLTDGNEYVCPADISATTLSYTRTFGATSWAPLYVPFNMSYDEWCNDATVAELSVVHMYDDGRTIMEFITVKSGDIMPNTPYVIKPNASGTVTFECSNKTMTASPVESSRFISCGTPRYTYKFFGNYKPMTAAQLETAGAGSSPYIMAANNKFAHAASDATLAPFRFYIVKSKSDNGYWGAPTRNTVEDEILIMIDGELISADEASGIVDVIYESEDGIYYDLNGRIVQNPSHGIYIHNGQKIYIK